MYNIKKIIIEKMMNLVKEYNKDFDNDKLDEIKYGLEGIYLTLTKIIVITLISILLGIFKEYIILLILFNIIRFTSFGIHASKSWQCWIASTITFIGMPLICKYTILNNKLNFIIIVTCFLIFLFHAPSDTPKRPIIKKKKRIFYKIATVSICLIYIILSFKTNINYIHNAFLASMIIECILIHPLTYKIFRIPYNNYKTYDISKD